MLIIIIIIYDIIIILIILFNNNNKYYIFCSLSRAVIKGLGPWICPGYYTTEPKLLLETNMAKLLLIKIFSPWLLFHSCQLLQKISDSPV